MPKTILIPIPRKHFDPSEVAVPWKILKSAGLQVVFATPDGHKATCDQVMLTGKKLGLLAPLLMADRNARLAYSQMELSQEFLVPLKWSDIAERSFDGLLLPGGHDKGMIEYLESELLQDQVSKYIISGRPVGAICHGVVLAARSKASSGKSILFGRTTTSLLASQELSAWALTKLWLKDYYQTYPETVEHEVKSCLASSSDFKPGPFPIFRDSPTNLTSGFVTQDFRSCELM